MAYLYNYVGKPWKTQRRVRQIMDELYAASADGLAGNEDCGQMSAWYVLSALGIYPVTPGLPYYAIGTPLFDRAALNLENGNRFTITAEGVSDDNIYIQSATLNGQPYSKSYLTHEDIMKGGEIKFVMGPEPNESRGGGKSDIPVAAVGDHPLTPVPYVNAESKTFSDSVRVELAAPCEDCEIYFTIDSFEPSTQSTRYTTPLVITESKTLKAVAITDDGTPSRTVIAEFVKIADGRSIILHSQYANQYSGGGDNALIDYQRGTDNFRTGSWQGYEGVDLITVVDLGRVEPIGRVTAGFLQDIQSWIWFPTRVEYAVSNDGTAYEIAASIENDFPDDRYGAFLREFSADVRVEARFVRVRATNYGECPPWHPGAGGKAWIFVDEITIE
jgi:hypothetical protein